MPDWSKVLTGQKLAIELRQEKIASHSTVLRALGGLGAKLMKDPHWVDRLAGLKTIDWSKSNKDWENVCIIVNSVISNRQARAATKAYIMASGRDSHRVDASRRPPAQERLLGIDLWRYHPR
jgi:DNA sulfur modification protein DndB